MDNASQIIFAAVIIGLIIPLLYVIGVANRFARLRNHIKESWADVDVQLQRRHDLIPNLVETIKAYAAYEQDLFTRIAQRAREGDCLSPRFSSIRRERERIGPFGERVDGPSRKLSRATGVSTLPRTTSGVVEH